MEVDDGAQPLDARGFYEPAGELTGAFQKPLSCVKWAPTGDLLAVCGADGRCELFEETAPETWTMARPLDAHCEGINDIAWSMDASYCCTASDDKTVRLWDVARGQPISSFDGHESYVFCCCLNPSNTLLATGSFDETVKVWDVRVQKAVKTINAHSEPVTAVAFNGSVSPASDRRRRVAPRGDAMSREILVPDVRRLFERRGAPVRE